MSDADVMLTARVSSAVDNQLSLIAAETGRTKSDIIRDAVIAFIGMYDNAKKYLGAPNEPR